MSKIGGEYKLQNQENPLSVKKRPMHAKISLFFIYYWDAPIAFKLRFYDASKTKILYLLL